MSEKVKVIEKFVEAIARLLDYEETRKRAIELFKKEFGIEPNEVAIDDAYSWRAEATICVDDYWGKLSRKTQRFINEVLRPCDSERVWLSLEAKGHGEGDPHDWEMVATTSTAIEVVKVVDHEKGSVKYTVALFRAPEDDC